MILNRFTKSFASFKTFGGSSNRQYKSLKKLQSLYNFCYQLFLCAGVITNELRMLHVTGQHLQRRRGLFRRHREK